jgi:enoyl-CoA hydratase/carnithine racemase
MIILKGFCFIIGSWLKTFLHLSRLESIDRQLSARALACMSVLQWHMEENAAGPIGRIQLNRPESMNALSRELVLQLADALARARSAPIRVLTITGSGRAFCAGADLKERRGMPDAEVRAFLVQVGSIFSDLASFPCPTIACLNGFAFGGGLELALCCDIRVALSNASMGLTEASLGIIPGAGGTQRLMRLVGQSRAAELIFSAARITAQEAQALGLINRVYADEGTMLEDLPQKIAANAPIALRQAKIALLEGRDLPLATALQKERELYEATLSTQDRLEALAAFQEKRAPIFKGK